MLNKELSLSKYYLNLETTFPVQTMKSQVLSSVNIQVNRQKHSCQLMTSTSELLASLPRPDSSRYLRVSSQSLAQLARNLVPNNTELLAQCSHLPWAARPRDHQWLKRLLEKVTFSRSTAGSTQQRGKGQCCVIMPDSCVCVTLTVVQCVCVCICVCVKRTAHSQSMLPSVPLCKPSVSWTYQCLQTHTSSRGYQRPYRGQILSWVSCVQPRALLPKSWEAQSAAPTQWPLPGSVNQTTQSASSLSVLSFRFHSKFKKTCPSSSSTSLHLEVKHLVELDCSTLKLTGSCLADLIILEGAGVWSADVDMLMWETRKHCCSLNTF